MDMLGLLIAVVIAIPVLAIVSIVLTLGTREHVKRLEFRLASLETRLAGTAGPLRRCPQLPSRLRRR